MNKKFTFKTYIEDSEDSECNSTFTKDFTVECEIGSISVIDIFSSFTGNPANSILNITVPPTKGTAIISGGEVSYTNTSGIGGDIDYIGIAVKEVDCTYGTTVVILIKDELTLLPVYTVHKATRQTSEALACAMSGALNITVYMDGLTLLGSSLLYIDARGLNRAPAGYYRIGTVSRYWSGTMFEATYFC